MRAVRWIAGAAVGVLFLTFARTADASSMLFFNYTGESVYGGAGNEGLTLGTEFTVGAQALQVISLGAYDENQDGMALAMDVGLWEAGSQTLIASTTIPAGSGGTLLGDWRFVAITPVMLAANTTYRIGALFLTGADGNPYGGSANLGPGIAGVTAGSVYGCSPGCPSTGPLFFPTVNDGLFRLHANMEYELVDSAAVPEPGTLALLGMGLGGALARRRRMRG
jgi:hypothetical protein